MKNEEYSKELAPQIEELQKLRDIGKTMAAGIIGQSLLKEDFFFCAATDRCMHLIDGFICMIQERNLTCAGALLRLQMDNCMRTYAAFIAEDKNAVIDCIIDGNPINKLKSKDGKRLSDAYLKKAVSELDSCFSSVYDQASGYIVSPAHKKYNNTNTFRPFYAIISARQNLVFAKNPCTYGGRTHV